MKGNGQFDSKASTALGKETRTHWIGGRVGFKASLDTMTKRSIYLRRESNRDSPIVQQIAFQPQRLS
jgi:hypothetical protein